MNKYFITTAIPYINAPAHIGHAQEFLIADTLSAYLKSQGHRVLLQSGTDDNSLKNVLSADRENIPLHTYLGQQGEKFRELISKLNIHPDYFIQTSHKNHHECVKDFISSLDPTDLYLHPYQGNYCIGCEDFLKPQDLTPEGVCPDHLTKPNTILEENVFFKLSKYQQQIYDLINEDKIKITPSFRKKEILNFISQGLTDISISRPQKEAGFGVPFPNRQDQVVYVWIDALINYLTGFHSDDPNWRNSWSEHYKIHVIGKNVWKFHAIYWIGLLLSAGLDTPQELLIHGFLTNEGVKISKSLGNAIDPLDVLKNHQADVIRAFLVGRLNFEGDGDFKQKELDEFYLEEVINQVANLFPRVNTLVQKENITYPSFSKVIETDFNSLWSELLSKSQKLNKEINDSKIWTWPSGEDKNHQLLKWVEDLCVIATYFKVFFPSKIKEIDLSLTGQKVIFFKKKEVVS